MEMTCDILKKTSTSERYREVKTKFRELKLNNLSRSESFKTFTKIINKQKYLELTKRLLQEFVQNVTDDLSHSILMAYCMSAFPNNVFSSKTRFETKLLLFANKIVIMVENLINDKMVNSEFYDESHNSKRYFATSFNNDESHNSKRYFATSFNNGESHNSKRYFPPSFNNDEFISNVDHYYSLYKTWQSEDHINNVSNVYDLIQEDVNIIQIQQKRNIECSYSNLNSKIIKLFCMNPKYATRILLHNYNIFTKMRKVQKTIWNEIYSNYNNNKEIMFLILTSEIKIKLIQILTFSDDRKEIYYGIETENIINKMRIYELSVIEINDILTILQNKVHKLDSDYIIKHITKNCNKEIIPIFKEMFAVLLECS